MVIGKAPRVETTRATSKFVKEEKCGLIDFAFGWIDIFMGQEGAKKHPYIELYCLLGLKKLESYRRENEDRLKRILQNTTEFDKKNYCLYF